MKQDHPIAISPCPVGPNPTLEKLFGEIKQLEDIHNNLDDVIWAATFDPYSCLYLNKSAEKVFGYPVSEMLNDSDLFTECIHPADRETFYESVSMAYKTGKSSCEFRVQHMDGSTRRLRGQAILHSDEHKQTRILAGTATDITGETLAREALMASKLKLRAIIDNTTDLIWSADLDMRVVEANKAYRNFVRSKLDIDVVEGLNMLEILPGGDMKTWQVYIQHVLTGNSHSVMHEWVEEGEQRYSKLNFNPMYDKDGLVSGLSCFVSDVTEQCLQLLEIERKNRLLVEIAYLQSHQVRGPVATLLGLVKLFNRDDPSDVLNIEILDGFEQAAQSLDDVIREIDIKTKNLQKEAGTNTSSYT